MAAAAAFNATQQTTETQCGEAARALFDHTKAARALSERTNPNSSKVAPALPA
jgi:hypothetical protein